MPGPHPDLSMTPSCAGVQIRVAANSPSLRDGLLRFLTGPRRQAAAEGPGLRLDAEVSGDLGQQSKRVVTDYTLLDEIDAPGFARRRYQGALGFAFVYPVDGCVAQFDPQQAWLRLWVDDDRRLATARFAHVVVADLLRFALPFFGISFLHAACVASAGRGVMLSGASGAGKSIVALRLLEDGFRFVADDHVALRRQQSPLACYATPEAMSLTPQSLPLFPLLAPQLELQSELVDAYFQKRLFLPQAILPDVCVAAMRPTMLVELAKVDGSQPAVLSPIRKHDAFLHLVRENFVPFHRTSLPQFAAEDVRLAGTLIDVVRCYRLVFSADRLSDATRLIRDAVHELGEAAST